jgi:hypothetical protein
MVNLRGSFGRHRERLEPEKKGTGTPSAHLCVFAMISGTRSVDKKVRGLLSGVASGRCFLGVECALLDSKAIRDLFTWGYDTMGNGRRFQRRFAEYLISIAFAFAIALQLRSVQFSCRCITSILFIKTSKSTNETNPLPLKQPNPTAWNDTPGMLFSPRGESSTTFSRHTTPLAR